MGIAHAVGYITKLNDDVGQVTAEVIISYCVSGGRKCNSVLVACIGTSVSLGQIDNDVKTGFGFLCTSRQFVCVR